jgi:hypothetical protein
MSTLLEQAIEFQRRKLAELETQRQQIEAGLVPRSQVVAARTALEEAQRNPATPPATLASLQETFNNLNNQRQTGIDNLSSVNQQIIDVRSALNDNEARAANPANNTGVLTPGNTTADPGTNPQINQQTQAQANVTTGAIPAGQSSSASTGIQNPSTTTPPPEPINGLDLPPPVALPGPAVEPINGLDLPPTPAEPEFGDLNAAIERQQASDPVLSEDGTVATGIRRNTETGEIFYTDPPPGDDLPFDEFAGVDEAVAQQKQIALNTEGQPVLAEDGSVAEGILRNPETGEIYYTQPPTLPNSTIPGTPYDDDGNLNPGWTLDEDNNPVFVGGDFVEPATQQSAAASRGLAATQNARRQATDQDVANFKTKEDWRVRLSLAPESKYLYNAPDAQGILQPLAATDGVIFPYTPNIQVQYAAHYTPTDLTHSNYKIFQYTNSSIDSISITCDFTAQDTSEANYLLAVIHFFRTVTKMFYGQDKSPKAGTPPPLCYLSGLGQFQFDAHPLAVTGFTYSLPTDVDYIRASATTTAAGVNKSPANVPINTASPAGGRMQGINPGGVKPPPRFQTTPAGTIEPTYVPTKMQIQISAVPIISRNDISNNFSLKKYATGELLLGAKNKRAGMW